MSPTVLVLTDKNAEHALAQLADRIVSKLDPKPKAPVHPDGFDWLPLKRVQQLTGWSKPTLSRKRSSGELPYSLIGQSVFVHVDDLRALMERHRTAPKGTP